MVMRGGAVPDPYTGVAVEEESTSGLDQASLREYARAMAEDAGLDPDVVERLLDMESGFEPFLPDGSVKLGAAGERGIAQIIPKWHPNVNPDKPYEAIDYLIQFLVRTSQQFGGGSEGLAKAVASWNAGTGTVASGRIPESTQRYVNSIMGHSGAGGPVPDPYTGVSPTEGTAITGTTGTEPASTTASPVSVPPSRPPGSTGGSRPNAVKGFTPLRDEQLPPRRSFSDILGLGQGMAPFNPDELGAYFPVARDPEFAYSNLLEAMGMRPAAGNPIADQLLNTAATLGRSSGLVRRAGGGFPMVEDMTDPEQQMRGAEGLRQVLSDVGGGLMRGNTSRFNPQEGMGFLGQVADLLGRSQELNDPGQMSLATELEGNPASAVQQWYTDILGGGMSPFLMAQPQLLARTFRNLFDNFTRTGRADRNFLDFILGRMA